MSINGPLCHANSEMLEALIPFNNINTIGSAKAKSYDGETLIETADGEKSIKADSVVLAVGYESEKVYLLRLKIYQKNNHVIGNANRVSNIMYAIWDAYEVASNIE